MKLRSIFILFCLSLTSVQAFPRDRWSVQKARNWHKAQDWVSGCNFQPSTAINQIEMWQSTSIDSITIRCELNWAK